MSVCYGGNQTITSDDLCLATGSGWFPAIVTVAHRRQRRKFSHTVATGPGASVYVYELHPLFDDVMAG